MLPFIELPWETREQKEEGGMIDRFGAFLFLDIIPPNTVKVCSPLLTFGRILSRLESELMQ